MKEEYQLICSYVKRKYYVSTAYRKASVSNLWEDVWFFETIAWEWNGETKQTGKIVEMEDSGYSETQAITAHFNLVNKLLEKEQL